MGGLRPELELKQQLEKGQRLVAERFNVELGDMVKMYSHDNYREFDVIDKYYDMLKLVFRLKPHI